MPNDHRLSLTGDGVFFPLRFQELAHRTRSYSVTSPLVAIIDDDEALCSSLVDLMRSVGYHAEPYSSAETFPTSSNLVTSASIPSDLHTPAFLGLHLLTT